MIRIPLVPIAAVALGALLGAPTPAQGVGTRVPLGAFELEDFRQTTARSLEDFSGRAVLIEFFKYT